MDVWSDLMLVPLAINWSHDGSIVDLGFYDLRWYSVLFAFGFVLSFFLLKTRFRQEQVPDEKLDVLLVYVVIATIVGARLGHCLFYEFDYYSENPLEIFLPFRFSPSFEIIGFQGLASHGGAIGIFVAILIYSRRQKLRVLWVFDQLAFVIPLACAFIRLGNLFNSEMIGSAASVPWAIVFQQIDFIPRHPGQLYEAFAYLSIFVVMYIFSRGVKREEGFAFGMFLLLMFSARFIVEFFKTDQVAFESGMMLNMGQILSIPFVLAGCLLMLKKSKTAPSRPVSSGS
jgi:phosphatidylglycerol:prolipoprotein diacylglycerol transferase